VSLWYVLRPDAIKVWENPVVVERLRWYYDVMRDRKPAKFMICKRLDAGCDPSKLSLEELWKLHDDLSKEFGRVWSMICSDELSLDELPRPKFSYLDVKIEIAKRILLSCHFCEHRCGVNRLSGERGFCRLDYRTYVHSWFHHYGEEAPLVPSGTIFYGSCNFRCVFCQNWDISQEHPLDGVEVDAWRLALMQKELRKTGARNINHVGGEPTPNLHTILESLKYLDVNVPQLWNSNMYCSVETMKLLKDVIDIWLPDFKYGNNKCAERLSGIKNYWEVVTRNLKIAAESAPMIIRHLVLPNHIECCTRPVLKWIADNIKDKVLVNVMEQYRPEWLVSKYPEKWPDISRRLRSSEIEEAYAIARELGIVYEPVS